MVEKVLTASFETLRGLSVNGIQILQRGQELGGYMDCTGERRISIQSQKVLRQQRLVLRFLKGCFLWMTLCVCF